MRQVLTTMAACRNRPAGNKVSMHPTLSNNLIRYIFIFYSVFEVCRLPRFQTARQTTVEK